MRRNERVFAFFSALLLIASAACGRRAPATTRATRLDFNGDGKADFAVFRPSTGVWYFAPASASELPSSTEFGGTGTLPVPGDYDGSGKWQCATFRQEDGTWRIRRPSGEARIVVFGQKGDVHGRTDVAVCRPATAMWYGLLSSTGPATVSFGARGDLPVPRDYDGDGRDDLAVFRPQTGFWYLSRGFSSAVALSFQFGRTGDRPVPADFDGDGVFDPAVFRPAEGSWHVRLASPSAHWKTIVFGSPGDIVLAERFGGQRTSELAAFRPSTGTWFVLDTVSAKGASFAFGRRGDWPLGALLPSSY